MIRRIHEKVSRISNLRKNILILTSGSVIAQGLVILASPFLSRLYSQEAFGLLALYTSIATIFASVFTGKYELAIFHPKDDSKALNLILFTILQVAILSAILFLIISCLLWFNTNITVLKILKDYVYLIPISTLCIGLYSCLQLWFQRKEQYKTTSITAILQSIAITSLHFFFFLIGWKVYGLVMGYFFSLIVPIIFLVYFFIKKQYLKDGDSQVNIKSSLVAAKEYINFPKYTLLSEFTLTLSQQFFPILLTTLYSASIVGLYSFANRILRIPSILISNSVWGVYRNEAMKLYTDKLGLLKLYKKTLINLLLFGIGPFAVLCIFGKDLFVFIFGDSWERSGLYAQIMSVYIFSEFIAYPLSTTFLIFKKQRIYMWIQSTTFLISVLGIYIGKIMDSDIISIILFSTFGTICNIISIFFSYKIIVND